MSPPASIPTTVDSDVAVAVCDGGPGGGKSTTIEALTGVFGRRLHTVPETATMLFGSGYPGPPDRGVDAWLEQLQRSVYEVQFGVEQAHIQQAVAQKSRLVLLDRAAPTGAAYMPGGADQWYKQVARQSRDELFSRYDIVLIFPSTAVCNPRFYSSANNPHRYESLDEAKRVEYAIRAAWDGHPNVHILPGENGLAALRAAAINLLSPYIQVEIEKRWKLYHLPNIDLGSGVEIEQGYFFPNSDWRIRRMGDETFMTSKLGTGLQRDEWQTTIPRDHFEALWPRTIGQRVSKTRYFLPDGWELDVFHDHLVGVVILERNFQSSSQAKAFPLPDWAREARAIEVTDNPIYGNHFMAIHGRRHPAFA